MSEDDVRAMIRRKALRFAKRAGSTGISAWGKAHNVPHVSDFLNGKRGAETKILDVLGLEWRICRKRKSA